jgi:hypothetical protein
VTTEDPDLQWFLCVCPSLLGQRSGHAAVVAALEGGGSGAFDSTGAEALIERARPHLARARRLGEVWAQLDLESRKLLTAHYTPRSGWSPGVVAALGMYAGAVMSLTRNREKLELACCHVALEANRATIGRELGRAERAVRAAHARWRDAKNASMIRWVRE